MTYLYNSHSSCRHFPARRASLRNLLDLYRQRRALARLDDAALKDLGLTRYEAQSEANRLPWDIPAGWRR